MQLWDLKQKSEEVTQRTPSTVQLKDARFHRTSQGAVLRLRLDVDEYAPLAFSLRPRAGSPELTDEMLADPQLQRVLWISHFQPPDAEGREWRATLVVTQPDTGSWVLVPLVLSLASTEPAPAGTPLDLHAVNWTEVQVTMTRDPVSPLDVAWRVAVTPLALAADVVLAIPLALVCGVLALDNPGFLTGG